MEKISNKWKELETADRERNDRNVRGREKTMETEIMVNSPLTIGMPRKKNNEMQYDLSLVNGQLVF